jgi:hypothetical protein
MLKRGYPLIIPKPNSVPVDTAIQIAGAGRSATPSQPVMRRTLEIIAARRKKPAIHSPAHRHAAADAQRLAGDVGIRIVEKKSDRAGYIERLANALNRIAGD